MLKRLLDLGLREGDEGRSCVGLETLLRLEVDQLPDPLPKKAPFLVEVEGDAEMGEGKAKPEDAILGAGDIRGEEEANMSFLLLELGEFMEVEEEGEGVGELWRIP